MSALNLTQVIIDSGISDDLASIKDFSLITLIGVCISGFVQISTVYINCILKMYRRKSLNKGLTTIAHAKNKDLKLDDNADALTNALAEDSNPRLSSS
jgi:hypothetical protein